MLRLPSFQFRIPGNLNEVGAILDSEGSSARVVAGGTDLWPNMKRRVQTPATVVSLMRIPALRSIEDRQQGGLRIGATATLGEILLDPRVGERYPALGRALASISAPALRNMGTLGGNLCLDTRCTYYNQSEEWRRAIDYCMKEQGETCWVAPSSPRCWAVASGDSAPMLCALDAQVHLRSRERGERTLRLADLFRDDGIDYLEKQADEILTAVDLSSEARAEHCQTSFWKLRRRGGIDFAVLSVAVAIWMEGERISRARIYLGSVASRPAPALESMQALEGQRPDPDLISQAARLARKVATPLDNTDFRAQWRGVMVERYTEAALQEALGLPVERLAPRHGLGAA
jgi:4-hydroxybenzoyl-CoA reductase subunit beta